MSGPRRVHLRAGGVGPLVHTLRRGEEPPGLRAEVSAIIASVREGGDDALVSEARRFGADLRRERIRVTPAALAAALGALAPAVRAALEIAIANVRAVAQAQLPQGGVVALAQGHTVRSRVVPVDSVGCYVPGGRAAYASSLVMAVVPAQVAGVPRIVIVSPPGPDGRVAAPVLAAAALLGVDEVYAAGGPAAVAALAYGTATIPPVAVVVGPGSPWVQEAKRQVTGLVGIESIAGPSEVMIVADGSVPPAWVAADLLAQAEHGADSAAVLASAEDEVVHAVEAALGGHAQADRVTLVSCASMPLAIELAEALAPEHLQLCVRDAHALLPAITRAGAVFVGSYAGTAFGDYVAGSNHVLPTGGAARFASALGPATFVRRMSVIEMDAGSAAALAPHVSALAAAEGLPAHGRSAEIRREGEWA